VSDLGWNVSTPVDLKNGCKFSTNKERLSSYSVYEKQKPTLAFMSFLNFKSLEDSRRRNSRRQRDLVSFCSWIIEQQIKQNKYFLILITSEQSNSHEFSELVKYQKSAYWQEIQDCDLKGKTKWNYYAFTNVPKGSFQCLQSPKFRASSEKAPSTTFVVRLAKDFNTFLQNGRSPDLRAQDVWLFEDLFCDASFSELHSLNVVCSEVGKNDNLNFSWINEISEETRKKSIGVNFNSPDLIQLLDAIQNLPKYSELALHNDNNLECQGLIPLVQNMRKKCLPTFEFEYCGIFRETFGRKINFTTLPEHTILVMWNATLKQKVYFLYLFQFRSDKFDMRNWNVIALWNDEQRFVIEKEPSISSMKFENAPASEVDPSEPSTIKIDMEEDDDPPGDDPSSKPDDRRPPNEPSLPPGGGQPPPPQPPSEPMYGHPDDPVFTPVMPDISIQSGSTELRPINEEDPEQSDTYIPQMLDHSRPSSPIGQPPRVKLRRSSPTKVSPQKTVKSPVSSSNSSDPSLHDQRASSSNIPILPVRNPESEENAVPQSIVPPEELERIITDIPDDENSDAETISYDEQDLAIHVDATDGNLLTPNAKCYMNTASFTVPTVQESEQNDILVVKNVKMLREHCKLYSSYCTRK